ncbi:MAG: GAF domain-containing protein [Xenococcaceae cyanobacterium]
MAYLIYAPETANEKIYQLTFGTNTIGRSRTNSIRLMDDSLSRHHVEIAISEDSFTIKDLKSLNHTFVNEVQIDQCELKDGDLIRCGNLNFKFTEAIASPRQESLDDDDLQRSILKKLTPKQTSSELEELVAQKRTERSVLKLRQQNTEQRAVDKLKILLEISKQLCSPEEPEKLLGKILDLLFKLMDIDRAVILMVNEESGQLEREAVKLQSGIPTDEQFYSKKITNFVRNNGDAILIGDARVDDRFNDSRTIVTQAIQASMCVPLKPHNEVIGVLYVDNLSTSAVYSDEDLEFLTALANQAAVAIHMAREVYNREQKLKQQVVELQIQIDQSKKESEVAEIVGSDYFKELQQRAKKLRASSE